MGREPRYVADGPRRRWVHGEGGKPPKGAERLLSHGIACKRRWASLGRAAGVGLDQVDAEECLWDLLDAGLVAIHERMLRSGDWEPYQWTTTAEGSAFLDESQAWVDIDAWLAIADPPDHPVLSSIRSWLRERDDPLSMDVHVVAALGDALRSGRVPQGRLLSVVVAGHTKKIPVARYREVIEEATGFELEQVVRFHGRSVLAYGPFSFEIRGHHIDGRWSIPWLALTPETLREMRILEVHGRRLLTIENLVPLEEEVRRGLIPTDTVVVFSGGFPHKLELDFLRRLCQAGVEQVDHWGDLDVGGIRILRHLQEVLPLPVRPFRMEPQLLHHLPTQLLTERDEAALCAWIEDEDAPCRELAAMMLNRGAKAEQEGWHLLSAEVQSRFET